MTKRPKTNHIHLNGRLYDATTGELLHGTPRQQTEAKPEPPKPHVTKHQPAYPSHHARHAPNHISSHAPKPSNTLMRQAVKKPSAASQRRLKAQGRLGVQPLTVVPKPSVWHLDEIRIRHAKRIKRSHLISHFLVGATYARQLASTTPARRPAAANPPARKHAHSKRQHPRTTADILAKALEHASSYREVPVK